MKFSAITSPQTLRTPFHRISTLSMDQYLPTWFRSPLGYLFLALTAYAGLCKVLRFRRQHQLERNYGLGQRPLSTMTTQEAYDIQHTLSDAEFPTLFEKSLQIALFRTYGIPTIAKLLNATHQLSKTENVAKRYADTAIILTEIYSNDPSHPRTLEAFARLNYLHGHYIKAGRISNDDMLYTLSVFVNHPVEWINRYEWRQLTLLEVCAIATFHKTMGESMHISFDPLPSSKTGWRDGLHFYEEIDTWAKAYETKHMLPSKHCHDTAIKTKELFLTTVPSFARGLVSHLLSAAMDDRLREAIMFDPAHPMVKSGLEAFMTVRRFLLLHLALPRIGFVRNLSKEETPEGRRYVKNWGIAPHYVKPTFWSRWGPLGLFQLAIGAPRPGDEGMCPEGYLRSNMGPKSFDGKGKEFFESELKVVRETQTRGCPFINMKR